MDDESTALSIITDATSTGVMNHARTGGNSVLRYTDDLARAGMVADELSREDAFAEYHANCTENTHAAQHNDLKLFAAYLAWAGVKRDAGNMCADAEAWCGMSRC